MRPSGQGRQVRTWRHFSVVMSSCSVTTLGMGLMGTKSTPGVRKRYEHRNPSKLGSSASHAASPLALSSHQDPQSRIPFLWPHPGTAVEVLARSPPLPGPITHQ